MYIGKWTPAKIKLRLGMSLVHLNRSPRLQSRDILCSYDTIVACGSCKRKFWHNYWNMVPASHLYACVWCGVICGLMAILASLAKACSESVPY
jgi:hypothetical protein